MSESNSFQHPLWLAGFRPFFTLAFFSGAVLPLLWGAVFAGWLPLPASAPDPLVWHGHEMFFGFGWAVLGGFLLTASKNWVGVRGIHGGPLALAALFWIVERLALPWAEALPGVVRVVLLNASVLFVGGYVFATLVRHRKTDSFRDNYHFLIALPLLLVAKNLTLERTTFALGTTMTQGLFRLAFVVMLERTMPQFMKARKNVSLLRNPVLDTGAKVLTLAAAFQALLPTKIAAALLVLAATLLLVRFLLWKPLQGLSEFGMAVMYVGYLGLVTHLYFEAARLVGAFPLIGAVSLHTFTFLCMGIIIPGMLIRICQGHTGRKLLFTGSDRAAILTIGAGAFFRLIATQLWPAQYTTWVALSALSWTICFTLLGVRLAPMLFQPRVDGRLH